MQRWCLPYQFALLALWRLDRRGSRQPRPQSAPPFSRPRKGRDNGPMREWLAGRVSDFDAGDRQIVSIEDREVVVFRWADRFYALENDCLHMGGPVGEGLILGKVEAVLSDNKELVREVFSDTEIHLVCPWHGWEYDIETG